MAWTLGALMVGCSSSVEPEAQEDATEAETDETESPPAAEAEAVEEAAPHESVALSQPPQEELPWEPAWAIEGERWLPGPGLVATRKAVQRVEQGTPCAGGLRVPLQDGAVYLEDGQAVEHLPAPAVSAVWVERAAWRLGEVLGPAEGIIPGGRSEKEPARHHGARVRSVRKTRRVGPPVLVIVGERRGRVAVLITDKEADQVYDSVVFAVPGPPWPSSQALPVQDLDGDGAQELVVYGDHAEGPAFRASLAVDLGVDPRMELQRIDTRSQPLRCAPTP